MITELIPAGIQMVAVDERGLIVGCLIPLDSVIIELSKRAPKIRVQEVKPYVQL